MITLQTNAFIASDVIVSATHLHAGTVSHCRRTCLSLATNVFCDTFGSGDKHTAALETNIENAGSSFSHTTGDHRSRNYYYHYYADLPTMLERSSGPSNIKLNWYGLN